MAEALAIVGVVASIIQLVDFSSKLLVRLDEFQSSLGEVPKSFRHIKAELPVLRDTLQHTKEAIDAGFSRDETNTALIPAIEGCMEQIRSLDDILTKTLPRPNDSRLKRGTKAIWSLHQDAKVESITQVLRGYVGTLTFYYAALSSTLQPLADAKLIKIRQWLSPPDPSLNYQKALKLHQGGTGAWLLESEEYIGWKIQPASFLWLYGIPGCGKTILSSAVLQDFYQGYDSDPGRVVAYFYFDFNDSQKQIPGLMVRSLISQLSQQCIKIPPILETLYSSYENGQRQPSLDSLLEVLKEMIHQFPHTYIVLDALDECTDRIELLSILESIAGWRFDELHLLVTSRKERDIESSLECLVDESNIICLQSKLVDEDIRSYVHQRLTVDKNLKKWLKDSDIMYEIETALMKGSQGMFRWAVCQLDTLGSCRNRSMLRKSLKTLPATLDETYDRILRAIKTEDSEYAIRILRWLTFSLRPLSVEEISEVIAIDYERDPMFDCDEILEDPLEVLNICSSLVTIATTEESTSSVSNIGTGSSQKVVALAHYSVKEYLISERGRTGPAKRFKMQATICNEIITKSCIGYILQFREDNPISDKDIGKFKLARYSAQFWINHAQSLSSKGEQLNLLIMELFQAQNGAYLNWIRLYDPDKDYIKNPDIKRSLKNVPTPLYYASQSGLNNIIELLLARGADINAQGGVYGNALQAASAEGHQAVVELLLARGADINAQGGRYGNALQAASAEGHQAVVELLLARGADINAQGGRYGMALQAASAEGHQAVVELLLARGADINAQGGGYGNALQAASAEGHQAVVELLLTRGADINAQGGHYGNALQAASARGHQAVVELLLARGADINAQGGRYGNALQAASAEGHQAVVELLLTRGADINAQGGRYGNALQAASVEGHQAVVELLLARGADINAQGGGYGNALQAASTEGYQAVVELLLTRGADINAQGGRYGNALQAASARGHQAVVELLLTRGADISA